MSNVELFAEADADLDFALLLARLSQPDPAIYHPHAWIEHTPHSLSGTGMGITYNLRKEHGAIFIEIPEKLLTQRLYDDGRKPFEVRSSVPGSEAHPAFLVSGHGWCILTLSYDEWKEALREGLSAREVRERFELTDAYAMHCRNLYSSKIRNPKHWRESFAGDGHGWPDLNRYEEARLGPFHNG